MKGYNNILVATDLSAESHKVADRAADMAKKAQAKLSIAHIIQFNPVLYGGGEFAIPWDQEVSETVWKQVEQALHKEGERLHVEPSRLYLKSGPTTDTLEQLVKEAQADLLVVGSHEHSGLAYLLGSTANALLHAMPCDILAVHVNEAE
jgi:universal stress protein A